MTTSLDSFETALLAELRRRAIDAPTPAPTPAAASGPEPAGRRPRRPHRRWLLAPIAAGTAAAALVVLPGLGSPPAYAITVDGDGDVHVRVHRLEDADELARALAAQGVPADVTYLPADHRCAPGRYADAPDAEGGFRMSFGDRSGYEIDLDAGVIRPGDTLVIAAARISAAGDPDGDGVSDDGGLGVEVGVATGEVAPCVPEPLPDR